MAILKFRRDGAEVEVVGMNAATETLVDRLGIMTSPARSTADGALRDAP
jgi:SulP family sulfate permease